MPDESVEQSTAVIPGAEEATVGASVDAPEIVLDPVAGDGGAVPAAPPVSFDLTTDAGIRAAAEANPTLRGYFEKLQADAANAARQRRDSELRREQGTIERANAYHRQVIDALAAGTDPEEIARQTPFFVKANHDFARIELSRNLLDHAQTMLEPGEAAALKAMAEALSPDDADGFTNVAQAAINAVVAKGKAIAAAEAKADADRTWQARLEAEVRAARVEQEAATRQNPPTVTGSGPAATSAPDQDLIRLQRDGIPIQEEATRKRIAAALGLQL